MRVSVKKICKLTDNNKTDACNTQKENYEKLNWNTVSYRSLWMKNQSQTKTRLLNKFTNVKTEEKGNRKIADINKQITQAHHVPADRTCVSAKNISKRIKKKHTTCKQFNKDKRTPAILLKLMTRPQKNPYLETEK